METLVENQESLDIGRGPSVRETKVEDQVSGRHR
jgi:hypothetical protein